MRSASAEIASPRLGEGSGGGAHLLETATAGVYLKTEAFDRLMTAIARAFEGLPARAPDLRLRGGAVMAMGDLERSAYVDRFPQLVAQVAPLLPPGDASADRAALAPAACLCLYPLVAARGALAPDGLSLAVSAPCHRTETEYSRTRLRIFTMSEHVVFGRPADVRAFVDALQAQAEVWLRSLELSPIARIANDPFYGRGAEIVAQHQRALRTKIELVLPIGEQSEVACLSFNLHGAFFTQRWDIALTDGGAAESACVGVGLERLGLALIERHGDRPEAWPEPVRRALFESAA